MFVLSAGRRSEKPPQDNDIIRSDSFSYKMICQNVPVPVYTAAALAAGTVVQSR